MPLTFFLSLILFVIPQVVLAPNQIGQSFLTSNEKVEINQQSGGDKIINSNFLPEARPRGPQKIESDKSLGIETTAKSAIVMDEETGVVLFKKDVEEKLSIASLTKLMTALVFLDGNPDWDKKIELLKEDEEEGGIFYARAGEEVQVKDLFNMMLVGSVNNAATALARSTGMSREDFVEKMNEKAQELRLKNTFFTDPSGLGPTNVSTAHDVAILISRALENDKIRETVVKKRYVFSPQNIKKTYYVKNTDELLWGFLNENPYQIIGGKTGYLDEAKYCLAIEVENNNHKIIVVVLGSNEIEDRFQEAKGLVVWTFENYKW
jgi:D-alanyl-D-alanine carboxypeptidase